MNSRITREVVESYLKCKTKARLQLAGEPGTASDYGLLLAERRTEIRRRAIGQALSHFQEAQVLRGVVVTSAVLSQGAPFLQDATLMDDTFSLTFDALKKAAGGSGLGEFHYLPVLCHEGENVRLEERLLLAVLGVVLGDLQGRQPGSGVVYYGREC